VTTGVAPIIADGSTTEVAVPKSSKGDVDVGGVLSTKAVEAVLAGGSDEICSGRPQLTSSRTTKNGQIRRNNVYKIQ
jgi:hypothetical protein